MSEPSAWVRRYAGLVAPGARVLDLAAGSGRHARFFAGRGARVVAVDRDADALSALAGIDGVEVRCADLEAAAWPLAGEMFDAVIVSRYLYRPRFDALLELLAPAGALLYETFAAGNERYGRPSNPAFLLEPGELLDRVRGRLVVVAFEQGAEGDPPAAVLQRLAAVGRARAWPPPIATATPPIAD
ncbi:MAG TPA: class I SAM-dependent methyltransferase [Casimicrobiaceae bacterium]